MQRLWIPVLAQESEDRVIVAAERARLRPVLLDSARGRIDVWEFFERGVVKRRDECTSGRGEELEEVARILDSALSRLKQ